ncbi:MAG: hypothetical protein JSR21_00030 [Proteobacteria bacterium]|nr:hypothetical protein [Pseudomonadota bacterium]
MYDLWQQWGSDLAVGATGDLATTDGSPAGEQRVLRRLMTNPGDYIWHLPYGAGLAQFVGQQVDPLQITAVIRSQIFKESVVARSPEPAITVRLETADGSVYAQIRYTDALSNTTRLLTLSTGG